MKLPSAPEMERSAWRDYVFPAAIAAVVAIIALICCYRSGLILLYGDAVAHINIARRVFDSRTPGLFQLGTVWLPLPHLIDIPFIAGDWSWRTGVGAAIPSLVAYVAGALGIFRLVRGLASRTAAWIASLIYVFNPNLIYMQATAMTEALYLALFVWSVVFFSEFVRQARGDQPDEARRSIERCAIALATAMMVRYDAWFLAPVVGLAAVAVVWKIHKFRSPVVRGVVSFFLLTSLTGGVWLAYNQSAYANPLEFANGPYSARAIQQRSRTATMPTYPGENSPRTAALYVLKVSRLNLGQGRAEYLLMTTALVALLSAIYFSRKFLPWALLWTPLVFYVISVAWGSVPIYFPDWWPFSYYNVRYGLQLLPAVAAFVALGYEFLAKFAPARWVASATVLVIAASYATVWQHTPICLREAEANGRMRMEFDRRLARELAKLPPSATLMMDTSAHPGALEAAEIHFRRVLRESNPPFWEEGLTRPARSADYVVAVQGDDVARAVQLFPQNLEPVARVETPHGSNTVAIIYRSTAR
jgi:Dolichyl-phosphate-mannose-protein mannosyltransferase